MDESDQTLRISAIRAAVKKIPTTSAMTTPHRTCPTRSKKTIRKDSAIATIHDRRQKES
jgi:hypothetical protein